MAEYQLFPMHYAAAAGDTAEVERLIELGMSMDTQDKKGETFLQYAAVFGLSDEDAEENLIFVNFHKYDGCNQCAKAGYTPLLISAMLRNKDVANLLLRSGASVSGIDGFNFGSVLHWAASNGWLDIVQLVIERGEDVIEATDVNEQTPSPLLWATSKGHKDVVAFLIQAGADVNPEDIDKRTALHHASQYGYLEVVQLLVQAGADVNREDISKETALHFASEAGHLQVVCFLLEEKGLDINHQDYIGYTPLHNACDQGKVEVVEKLLAAGADPSIRNKEGETAFSIGIIEQVFSPKEIRLFFQNGVYFEDCDYVHILENSDLKELVLKDVDICMQSIINKFHYKALPALYCNLGFAKMIPRISNLKLSTQGMQDVRSFVELDISTNMFCNVVKARPIVLKAMCVNSLIDKISTPTHNKN